MNFSDTCVAEKRSLFHVGARKKENFTAEQVRAIRDELRRYQQRNPDLGSQKAMARHFSDHELKIGQQTMGGYLGNDDRVGMSRLVAERIVMKCGYDGLDHFFDAKGLRAGRRADPSTGDAQLDIAIRHARIVGVDDDVIGHVCERFKGDPWYGRHDHIWWMTRFLETQENKRAFLERAPPPEKLITTGVPTPPQLPPPSKPRRKKK